MIFSSVYFLSIFLPFFLITFYLARIELRKWVIVIFSLIFYAWGAPNFIYFLLASSVIDFFLSNKFTSKNKKYFLWVSLTLNIGLLAYFKYANFFVANTSSIADAFGYRLISIKEVLLPIGISFFTFQKISYAIDVYSGKNERLTNFLDYLLYIIMFPQLIAGPIVRYKDVSEQIKNYKENKLPDKLNGLYRFIIGLSKKVLIANTFAAIVSQTSAINLHLLSTSDAWIGILAYTFQIYFDFSGYSDMAIGLGLMIGFKFPENFNFPYLSKSITEFWQRWHITLGTWMRDYLYIPLGGNKVKTTRLYFNLVFVFFISGFWHGANWNFIIWGLYHGFFLMAERAFLNKILNVLPNFIQIIYTFFIVVIGWVFFSMELDEAIIYISKLFSFSDFNLSIQLSNKTIFLGFLGIIFSFLAINNKISILLSNFTSISLNNNKSVYIFPIMISLFILSFLSLLTSGFNPFIYYKF